MQYVLSEEEWRTLKQLAERSVPDTKELQELCSRAADEIVLQTGWMKGRVWGCILTVNKDHEWYCDECPAKRVCPYPHKEWSK